MQIPASGGIAAGAASFSPVAAGNQVPAQRTHHPGRHLGAFAVDKGKEGIINSLEAAQCV
jgi:hypothetical protein